MTRCWFIFGLLACGSCATTPPPAPRVAGATDAQRWTRAFDLDGDGAPDEIQLSFSGGAHCCYTLTVRLSSTGEATRLPFSLDGGYAAGLDLSRPDHFDVRAGHHGAEILMEVGTTAGVRAPLPAAWRQLGVSSHRIAVSFPGARLRVRNLPEGEGFVTGERAP